MAQRLRKLGIEGLSCKGGPCTSVGLTNAGLTCDEHGTAVRNGTATGMAPLVDERRWWRLLTVVIVTSPVPSNPDTSVLRAVFAAYSRVEGLLRARKVIHFDGPQPRLPPERKSAYEEFKRRVLVLAGEHPDFAHLQCYSADRFLFAAHNLAAAVAQVRTPYMLVQQHDYVLQRPFDARQLLRTMAAHRAIKHVRLNTRGNIQRGFDGVIQNYSGPSHVPLTRTCGWSDGPHVTATCYYLRTIIPFNQGDHHGGVRKFMEESVHYRMQRNGEFHPPGCWALKMCRVQNPAHPECTAAARQWPHDFEVFGTYLYGVSSAQDGSYMAHRSQRGNTPQWGLGNHLDPHLPDPNDPKEPQSKPAAPWPHALDTRRARLARQAEALSARVARATQQGRQGQQGQSKRRGKHQGSR